MKKTWILLGCLVLGAGGIFKLVSSIQSQPDYSSKIAVTPGAATGQAVSPPAIRPDSSPRSHPVQKKEVFSSVEARTSNWKNFSEKFGTKLKPQFSEGGQLVSIRGQLGEGETSPNFNPQDPQKSIARAREIIAAASGLMGLRPDFPLGDANTRGSAITSQVFMSESYEGIPLSPVGNVKIDLGTHGELVALYSDYAPHLTVSNQFQLSTEDAKVSALSTIKKSDSDSALEVDGGAKLIWVSEGSGKSAYEFMVQGRQVIVDAGSGKVLFNRDRRQY